MTTAEADDIDELALRLRPHYSRFLASVGDEILLTGHSHQAWPDVSRAGHLAAWDDAARLIDDKWSRILDEILPEFQRGVARRIGSSRPDDLAIAPSTHELAYRLATCFDQAQVVLTTDSEFHSLARQLARFEEDGLEIIRVPVEGEGSEGSFADRFVRTAIEQRPTWVALSLVTFTTSRFIHDIEIILSALERLHVPVLIDAYHAFNVLEVEVDRWPGSVFVVGGGYKYAQFGEGACWMLLPSASDQLRPSYTGWFSHFASLEEVKNDQVQYGTGGRRFLGATFDPSGIYRAVWVMRWMDEMGLDPRTLAAHSRRQTARIIDRFDALSLDRLGLRLATPRSERGGFVSLEHSRAGEISMALRRLGVRTDSRGKCLRLGPSPTTTSTEIQLAMEKLRAVCAD